MDDIFVTYPEPCETPLALLEEWEHADDWIDSKAYRKEHPLVWDEETKRFVACY